MTKSSVHLVSLPICIALIAGLHIRSADKRVESTAILPAAPVAEKRVDAKPIVIPRLLAVSPRIAQRVNDLRPGVRTRLAKVVEKLPKRVTLLVTSAARTRAEQMALTPTFGVKARPGTSTHEDGRGIDLNVIIDGERISPRRQDRIIGAAMKSEGFRYLGAMDPVHYSVPKWHLAAADAATAPILDVMSMDEAQELEELAAAQGVTPERPERVALAAATVAPETLASAAAPVP